MVLASGVDQLFEPVSVWCSSDWNPMGAHGSTLCDQVSGMVLVSPSGLANFILFILPPFSASSALETQFTCESATTI